MFSDKTQPTGNQTYRVTKPCPSVPADTCKTHDLSEMWLHANIRKTDIFKMSLGLK